MIVPSGIGISMLPRMKSDRMHDEWRDKALSLLLLVIPVLLEVLEDIIKRELAKGDE